MREIKFRAWLKPTKQMAKVTGIDLERSGTFRVLTPDNQIIWFGQVNISAIVMQFTGLLDKNGNEIYEGDVLACENKGPSQILWNYKWGGWAVKNLKRNEFHRLDINFNRYNGEIIGNIYENPYLLK